MADISSTPPIYAVRDNTKTKFIVALYTPNPQKDAQSFIVGHTLCITSARPHNFDGQPGFIILDPNTIEVCPIYTKKVTKTDGTPQIRFSQCL